MGNLSTPYYFGKCFMMNIYLSNIRLWYFRLPVLILILLFSVNSFAEELSSDLTVDEAITYNSDQTDGYVLTVNSDAIITVEDDGTLTIYGDLANYGTITVEEGGTLIVYGDLTSTGTFSVSGTVTVEGDVDMDSITIEHTGILSANTITVNEGEDFTVEGNLTITGTLTISGSLTVGGDVDANNIIVEEDGVLVVEGDLSITGSGSYDYGYFIVMGSADIKKIKDFGDNGVLVVDGDLEFSDTSMDDLSSHIYVGGSATNTKTTYTSDTEASNLSAITDEDLLTLLSNLGIIVPTESQSSGDFNDADVEDGGTSHWTNEAPVEVTEIYTSETTTENVAASSMDFRINDGDELSTASITVNSTTYYGYTLLNTAYICGTLTFGSEEYFEDASTDNDFTVTVRSYTGYTGELIVEEGGTVEIWGDLSNYGTITVESGGTLIIHGTYYGFESSVLTIEDEGAVTVYEDFNSYSSSSVDVSGTLVVSGDVAFYGQNNTFSSTATIVAGGTLTAYNYSNNSETLYALTSGGNVDCSYMSELKDNNSTLYDTLVSLGIIVEWTGESSDLWSFSGNWLSGEVPLSSQAVMISSGLTYYPVISETDEIEITSLTIESGASLTISAGETLHVYGDLEIEDGSEEDGTLTINNDLTDGSEALSSIIVDGDVTGEATEKWANIQGYYWWYLANPMSDNSPSDYVNSGLSSYYIRKYNNSTFKYDYNTSSSTISFDPLDAFGYAILNDDVDNTLSYSGSFNNEDRYKHIATYDSDNLYFQYLGNPYPSYIDFGEVFDSSYLSVDATCYIYTAGTSNGNRGYATYNAYNGETINNGTRYISPGQCFWVGTLKNDTITIPKSACINSPSSSVSLKSVGSLSAVNAKIRLVFVNDNTNDEVLIISDEDHGSDDITLYDSRKKMNSGKIGNIYTLKNDTCIAINSLPSFYDGDVIPLGYSVFSSGMSDFTISVSSLTNTDNYDIYLDDLEDGTSVELTDTTEYTFTPSEASSDDRFQIRIASLHSTEEETTTGIDETTSDNISVYSSGETAYVTASEEWLQSDSRMIYVYNIAGQLEKTEELDDLETQFVLPGEGIYLIKVVSGNLIYTEKVLGE